MVSLSVLHCGGPVDRSDPSRPCGLDRGTVCEVSHNAIIGESSIGEEDSVALVRGAGAVRSQSCQDSCLASHDPNGGEVAESGCPDWGASIHIFGRAASLGSDDLDSFHISTDSVSGESTGAQ